MINARNTASRRIMEVLTERIQQGFYAAGSRLPAERDLAAEFSLDRSLVRAALAELTRAGLIVREPGCRPRVAAAVSGGPRSERHQAIRRAGGLKAIAVVLPQHDADHGSRETVRGISHALRLHEAAYRPIIFDTYLRPTSPVVLEQEAGAAILKEGLAGAIVWPEAGRESLDCWRQVSAAGHPVVFIDRYDETMPCDFVGADNYEAARDAMAYLLGLGHTRIVHLTLDQAATSIREREAGYRDALRAAGPTVPETVWALSTASYPACLDEFVSGLLAMSPAPTAVFALNDQIAHTLIARLEAAGKSVPADLSVLGFDDDDQYSPRPALLTTIRQPFERIGQRAAALLLRRLGPTPGPAAAFQHILLPTLLVERSTCRSLEP